MLVNSQIIDLKAVGATNYLLSDIEYPAKHTPVVFPFAKIPPDPNPYPWKVSRMHILASLCGQRSAKSGQLDLFSAVSVEAPEDSNVFLQRPANDLGISQPSALPSLFQVSEISVVEPDRSRLADSLHVSNLPEHTLTDGMHAEFRTASTSYINNIQRKPVISAFVTPVKSYSRLASSDVAWALPPEAKALPLDWLLGPKVLSPLDYVLAGLVRVEAHARKDGDVWFAEDCRQTWIALYRAFVKNEHASYREAEIVTACQMFGCHQDQLQERITARRKSQLGAEYHEWFTGTGVLRPDINLPKKPQDSAPCSPPGADNGAEDTPIVAHSVSAPSPNSKKVIA